MIGEAPSWELIQQSSRSWKEATRVNLTPQQINTKLMKVAFGLYRDW